MESCKAVGIDLGTTYSCVAIWVNGKYKVILNQEGERTTPSVVSFKGEDLLVGSSAVNVAVLNPQNTVFDSKRLIGKMWNDRILQNDIQHYPFAVEESPEHLPLICVDFKGEPRRFKPEEISSMILAKMKSIVDKEVNAEHQECKSAVITVPAHFNNAQRKATKDAGEICGLKVKAIISEPTAAAIAYAREVNLPEGRNIFIFDLGGGTFDVSIASINGGKVQIKSTSGDANLGGEDFDTLLLALSIRKFE